MKILISGLGYIGSPLVGQLLNFGYKVIGLDNGFGRTLDSILPYCNNPNFTFIKGDAGDEKLLTKIVPNCDMIVSLHGLVGEPLCNKFPKLAWEVNHKSMEVLTQLFPLKPIIYSGTGSVYGKIDGICTEESPTNPISIYAESKLAAEQELKSNPHVIYRFATAFGLSTTSSFRLDLLVNDLAYQAFKNKTITLFQPHFRRTFCHVNDLVSSLSFAVKNFDKLEGQIYNVGNSNNNWSKLMLANFIKEKTHCSLFIGEDGYKDTDQRDYDTSFEKINNAGWQASINIEEGINSMLKAFPLINLANQYNFIG